LADLAHAGVQASFADAKLRAEIHHDIDRWLAA